MTESHATIRNNPKELIELVRHKLNGDGLEEQWGAPNGRNGMKNSAVLFLLTMKQVHPDGSPEPCLLLNKRSQDVRQPGDLCCPGGGIQRMDQVLAPFMRWPLTPLGQWPQWPQWRIRYPGNTHQLALLLTAGLREAFEEMRLNPLRVRFLGPLSVQKLIMFDRIIYPLAAWVPQNQNLKPNWEVERIVHIPLKRLLEPGHYGRYRLTFQKDQRAKQRKEDFPCFIHKRRNGHEVLWGVTFRITMDFLHRVYGFRLPDLEDAPIHAKHLGASYLNGAFITEADSIGIERDEEV